jgi:hypothetical protein
MFLGAEGAVRDGESEMVSRTLNPLHFEDLEPHRFEDLVRQLAYGYRAWKTLEATGRLGADGGLDIRGIELAGASIKQHLHEEDIDGTEGDDLPETPVEEEREWRIQCKRYREIGPQLMRNIVGEVIPEGSPAPHGLIIAAACDVSAATMAAFREEAAGRGVREAHLWMKAYLEDMLFQPENDHLLFAYFGISLQIRQRSEIQAIRATISLKRKLMRSLKVERFSQPILEPALIRDIDDYRYRDWDSQLDALEVPARPWHVVAVEWFDANGLAISPCHYEGWVKTDGSWDIIERPLAPMSMDGDSTLQEALGSLGWASENSRARRDKVPESERAVVREIRRLPYRSIREIDQMGDPIFEGCHLYCRFDGDQGPYVGSPLFIAQIGMQERRLEPENRRSLFKPSPPVPRGAARRGHGKDSKASRRTRGPGD